MDEIIKKAAAKEAAEILKKCNSMTTEQAKAQMKEYKARMAPETERIRVECDVALKAAIAKGDHKELFKEMTTSLKSMYVHAMIVEGEKNNLENLCRRLIQTKNTQEQVLMLIKEISVMLALIEQRRKIQAEGN